MNTSKETAPEEDVRSHAGRIALVVRHGEYALVADRPVETGELLMEIDGVLSDGPSRYSVQVGRDLHIAPPADVTREDRRERYLWRFLNHSCLPSAVLVGRRLVAARPIAAGEELSFDYNTSEYEMAEPFRCRCGHCDGAEIRGARFLSPDERSRREHLLASHLRDAGGPAL